MPVNCANIGGKFRIVDDSGAIETHASGEPLDGGGHDSGEACAAQARAINSELAASVVYLAPELDGWVLSSDTERVYRKQLIYTGEFEARGQRFSVDAPTLAHWQETFERMTKAGIEVPVPVEHTRDPEKRRGTLQKVERAKDSKGRDGLFGFIKFRDAEAEKLAASNVSIYVPPERPDGKGGKFRRPIEHVALTDYPVVPGLDNFQPIAASLTPEGAEKMSFRDLAKKLKIDLADNVEDGAVEGAIVSEVGKLRKSVSELTAKVEASKPKPSDDDKSKSEDAKPATVSASIVDLATENRTLKLDRLVESSKITPAVRDKLAAQYCDGEALALSLAVEDGPADGFDTLVEALGENDPVALSESTGPQGVRMIHGAGKAEANPLVADAEERAEAAKA
jgi:hypothetical protein